MHLRHLFLLSVFASSACLCAAQGKEEWKVAGNRLLQAGQYRDALEVFLGYNDQWPSDAGVVTNAGICYYHLHQLARAEDYLYQAFRAKGDPPAVAYYYLGKVNHAKLEFASAIDFYKKYLRKTGADHPWRASVKDDIRRCATGMKVRRAEAQAAVLNLGDVVNTGADEFRPLLSPAGRERLYFASNTMANRPGNRSDCDVFKTDLKEGDWQAPSPISHFINSIQDEVPLGFGEAGQLLYFFRGKEFSSGDILVDTFRENATERTLQFSVADIPMETGEGDTAPFFFNDTILLFASRRAGSYGGLDLYVSTRAKAGWSVPQNLGPAINTPYDETSPFLASDGRTLYFSTNHPALSVGGLDLVKARYSDLVQQWLKPANVGIPLNSAGNDEHFLIAPQGDRAFFDSDRQEGFGKRDLYVALFDQPLPEQAKASLPAAFTEVPAFRAAMGRASESEAASPEELLEGLARLELRPLEYAPGEPFPLPTVRQLDLLAAMLAKYPGVELVLAVHTVKPRGVPDLEQGILPRLSAYFKAAGAPLENLCLRWAGSGYPLVEKHTDVVNRRIEAYIANPGILPFEVYYPGQPSRPAVSVFFENAMQRLFYQVSIPVPESGVEGFLAKLFEKYQEGMVTFRPATGKAYFHIGMYLACSSAKQWQQEAIANGYPEAVLTAWLKGWEISKEEAGKYVGEYADLQYFIQD